MRFLSVLLLCFSLLALLAPPPAVADGYVTVGFAQPSGYWTYQYESYWIPAQFVGYDIYGRAVVAPGHWAYRQVRVWIPLRAWAPAAPRSHWRIGFGFFFR